MGVTEYRGTRKFAKTYRDLDVYKIAFDGAMKIFELTKSFPKEEKYSLTDQIRRSSRSVTANIAEAWRKRRYKLAFVSKLNDSETEATETQVWLEYSYRCGYINESVYKEFDQLYEQTIGKLVRMIINPDKWLVTAVNGREKGHRK